jgi:glyoxylase-like metal-dependent hydrolase (beta-lactamase superfamily II)
MYRTDRRDLILSAAGAAALLGVARPFTFIDAAFAQTSTKPADAFKHFRVGDIQMTMLFDGSIDRPNTPGFVKNASVVDVNASLRASGLSENIVPNPFVVPVARVGGRTILFDAGTGGQVAPGAGRMAENMRAAGIDPTSVTTVLISHFHPDHIFGLMAKDTNAPVYPTAEIVMPEAEFNWWTDAAVFGKLPEARHGLTRRIQAVFPSWKEKGQIRLVANNVEVAPGIRTIDAPGHTPGHMAWQVGSGNQQLLVLADVVTYNPVFLRNPGWHASFDADGPVAEATRRKLLDRAVADNTMVTAYHFIFPSAGSIVKDGSGFAFKPIT